MYPVLYVASFAMTVVLFASPALGQVQQSSEIYNFHTNECLQPANESEGAAIVQEQCNGGYLQQWYPWSSGGNIIQYQNAWTAMWLDARGGAANGTPVQQWAYANISNENWQTGKPDESGVPPLISRVSGTNSFCLDIPGGQPIPGLAMQIYTCNGTASQEWWITAQVIK